MLALVVGCGALFVERSFDRGYLEAFYEMDLYGDLAPAVEQSWGDGFVPMAQVEVDTGCPVALFAVRIEPRPVSLVVSGSDGRQNAQFVEDRPGFNYFRPDRPVASTASDRSAVESGVVVSVVERDSRTNSIGGIGDPVVRAYCAVDDPEATRFSQMYPPQHPSLSRRTILGWADVRFLIGVAGLVVALACRPPTRHAGTLTALAEERGAVATRQLGTLPIEGLSPLLSIGSGTAEFRQERQPWIENEVFAPIERRGASVVHHEYLAGAGVDIVGDLSDPGFLSSLRTLGTRSVLCANVLEHLADVKNPVKAVSDAVVPGGYLIVTVPRAYPYHPDPIDTMFRPSPAEVAALFPELTCVASAEVPCGTLIGYALSTRGKLTMIRNAVRFSRVEPGERRPLRRRRPRAEKVGCATSSGRR